MNPRRHCYIDYSGENRRIVVFDLYGTLVDWRYSISSFIDFYVSREVVEEFFDCDMREVVNYRPYKEILSKCLGEIASRHHVVLDDELVKSFVLNFAKSPPFPDTIYGLLITRNQGFETAILSNTDRDLVEITLSGMMRLLDHVITAEDIKAYKPSLEAFKRTYEILNTSPSRVIHISAYPQYDLEPAMKLGALTILVDRGLNYEWPIKIRSLLELPMVLKTL